MIVVKQVEFSIQKMKKFDSISNSKITNYFVTTKKSEPAKVERPIEKPPVVAQQFYEKFAKCKGHCEKEELKTKIEEAKEKLAKIEGAIKSCRLVLMEKNMEIDNLDKNSATQEDPSAIIFDTFSNCFTAEQLKTLRSINSNSPGDSTFILNVVKFLYSDDLGRVKSKSACGRKNKGQSKEKMTPSKKKTLERIFGERLHKLDVTPMEKSDRKKSVNRLIKDAFASICKSLESKHTQNETCRRLDLENK